MKRRELSDAPDTTSHRVDALDSAAEDQLVRTFGPRIYVMALVRTRDPDAARDLCQSALLEVLVALRKGLLRDQQKLPGFVCGTARNVVNYYLRARRHAPHSEPLGSDTPFAEGSQVNDVEEAERLELLSRAAARLEPQDRQILRMTLVNGWDPAEIAARLGLSSEVVRQRKSRAVKRVIEAVRNLSRSQAGTPLNTDADTGSV